MQNWFGKGHIIFFEDFFRIQFEFDKLCFTATIVFTVSCLFVIVLKKIVITIIHATSICVIVLSRGTQFILMVIIKMNYMYIYIQLTFEKKLFIAFAIGFF